MIKKQYLKSKPVCKVTFTLPKEAAYDANEVRILGEFNDWNWEIAPSMKATKTEFKATIELATGRSYQFRYMIDQGRWENDWDADDYITSPYTGIENSVVVVEEKAAPAKKAPAKKAAPKKKAPAKKAVAKKAPAKKVTKATKDNLKKIEGIGPKIEQLMNEAGIMTFADLGKAKIKVLKDVLTAAGPRFKMHDPATWAKQAKLAAAEKWDQLAKLQDELKGGKKVKK
jgi:predicted flap endonuclease-1-like 5' DNA nuclease